MVNIDASRSCGHQFRHLAEVWPAFVAERFGLGVHLHVVVPGRSGVYVDGGAGLVIPSPSRDTLNGVDDTIELSKLSRSQ